MAHLVLYDGICGLCNRSVDFILRHDSQHRFLFASIQSEIGSKLLAKHGYSPDSMDTFVLIVEYDSDSEYIVTQSDAALIVMRELGGWCKVWRIAHFLPKSVRNWGYRLISRNRYSWFGKYDTCPVPSEKDRERFIDR